MARLFLCFVLAGAGLTGCASPDDRNFFYRGWINPRVLDEEPPSRFGPRNQPPAGFKADPLVDY